MWQAISFEVPADEAERWADALLAAGASSIDVSDPRGATSSQAALYDEPGEFAKAAWTVTRLSALFEASVDAETALLSAARSLSIPLPCYRRSELADQDWVRSTQAQFVPIRVTDRLWIVPSWCEPVRPDAINVTLDPGLAFGTGSHPTTLLCLRWLALNLTPGAAVVDYGCGSGILAIAAAKLGAGRVTGVDIDPQALDASRANAARNGIAARFCAPEQLPPMSADVLVSNILANPLELLAPLFAAHVRMNGKVVLSGILDSQSARVAAAYERWFNIAPWDCADEWTALVGVRRERSNPTPMPAAHDA